MYKEDKFEGGFGVLLLILECGSDHRGFVYHKFLDPTGPSSLAEKMLRAFSLFKDSSVGVWVPIRSGHQYLLSTSEQPFLQQGREAWFFFGLLKCEI
ncbi:hypothetical protein NC653_037410 [Populus alba x Populus x berolinensis]|uniref:Uncharacterized protein n=1 Tax=Populus alba x Populus x berolinensis TaxID=444605 RepID=A0AAD6LEJ5_9ROSI|nr:hypothetical protein NC653_037410 [Populus alba x Populus x berolinensis]